jgi:16S rRNA (guanine966-N2)-methyltransferase
MLRIIAGDKRGTRLETPEGLTTRPLRDRIREALFNILQGQVRESRVLDLFAGSGAVGLEALSRGARHTTFIEDDRDAHAVIRRNIERLGYQARATLVTGQLPGALARVAATPCDLVFVMPPYAQGLVPPVLDALARRRLVAPEGLVIVEVERSERFDLPAAWTLHDDRTYGVTRLVFLAPHQHPHLNPERP